MQSGHIVGIVVAITFIFAGSIAEAKKKRKKSKWGRGAIVLGIIALISAVINFHLFT